MHNTSWTRWPFRWMFQALHQASWSADLVWAEKIFDNLARMRCMNIRIHNQKAALHAAPLVLIRRDMKV